MATADKLSYLLETKVKIKDAINNDISLIEEDTIFREYPNKINTLSDTLKSYIPTGVKTDSSIQVNDAVPLNAKSLIIDGNSYRKTTKGINLFNYLENIGDVSGLTITTKGDYIVINGTTSNNYQLVIKDIDITDILEDGEIYTLWQENDTKSSSSDTFPKTAIRLRAKHINGNYVYTRVTSSKTVNFSVNKSTFENYCVDVVTPVSGEIYSNYKNKFMLAKGEYDESTIPTFEHYTGGLASPNPVYPQEIEVYEGIENLYYTVKDTYSFIFDIGGWRYINGVGGASGSNVANNTIYKAKVEKGKTYTFSANVIGTSNVISTLIYDDETTIKRLDGTNVSFNETFSAKKDGYVLLRCYITSNTTLTIKNVMLNKGSIAHPYVPYGTNYAVIKNNDDVYLLDLKDNFLAKINDAKDELNIISGILDKNIQKYTFTGEENWIKSGLSNEKNFVIALANDDLTNILKIIKNNVICTHFILSDNLNANGSFWLYNWSSSKQMYDALRFSFDINEIDSVEKAKQFFKNNEVIIYYQSISETIQLEPLKIKMYEGTNNIELTSNLETSMKLEYYKDYKLDTNDIEQNEIIE